MKLLALTTMLALSSCCSDAAVRDPFQLIRPSVEAITLRYESYVASDLSLTITQRNQLVAESAELRHTVQPLTPTPVPAE